LAFSGAGIGQKGMWRKINLPVGELMCDDVMTWLCGRQYQRHPS